MTGWKVRNGNNGETPPIQCSLLGSLNVFIEPIPKLKIELMMESYPSKEWLGYLTGDKEEGSIFQVKDLVIPPHAEASGASALAEPFHIPRNCVGFIHSHHRMGAFHSSTDQDHVDKNYPFSITVAMRVGNLEFDCVGYGVTPCGKKTLLKGMVKFITPDALFDVKSFLDEACANVDKGSRIQTYVGSTQIKETTNQLSQGKFPASKYVKADKKSKGKDKTIYPGGYMEFSHEELKRRGVHAFTTGEGELFTDGHGVILTKKEIDEHMKGIWGDNH